MYFATKPQIDEDMAHQLSKIEQHIDVLLAPQGELEKHIFWWVLSRWSNQLLYEVFEFGEDSLPQEDVHQTAYRLKEACSVYADFIHSATGEVFVHQDGRQEAITYAKDLALHLPLKIEQAINDFKPAQRWLKAQPDSGELTVVDYIGHVFDKDLGSSAQQATAGKFYDMYGEWMKQIQLYLCPIVQTKAGKSVEENWISMMSFETLQSRLLV